MSHPAQVIARLYIEKERKALMEFYVASSCARNLTLNQRVVLPLQPLQRPPPLLRQLRPSIHRDRFSEKPRFPLHILLFPLRSFFALPFFELLFQFCGFGETFGFYGGGDGGPEAEGFVGELGCERGDYFGGGEEGFEVDEEGGVLWRWEVVRRDG